MSSDQLDQKLFGLLESGEWVNMQLASQLIQGMGYRPHHLRKMIEGVTYAYLSEFLPDFDYHRFGCSILDRMTFELVFKKLNEYLPVSYLQVEVCSDYLKLTAYVQPQLPTNALWVEVSMEGLTDRLFYTIRAKFDIGQNPKGDRKLA